VGFREDFRDGPWLVHSLFDARPSVVDDFGEELGVEAGSAY
jgi:hypothetical protein